MNVVVDNHCECREVLGELVGHACGLFGAGSIVQAQRAGFDVEVPVAPWVRLIGRRHAARQCGLLVSGTIRPMSTSACCAAALRRQCFARQAT